MEKRARQRMSWSFFPVSYSYHAFFRWLTLYFIGGDNDEMAKEEKYRGKTI